MRAERSAATLLPVTNPLPLPQPLCQKVDDAYVARMGPRQARAQLLDRLSQHTENCAQCTRGRAQAASLARALTTISEVLRAAALLCGAAAAVGSIALPTDGEALASGSAEPPRLWGLP
jgi:anti-sigma factor RsiW